MSTSEPTVFLLIVVFVLVLLARNWLKGRQPKRAWKSTLTLQQYLQQHPKCKTDKGIKCCVCGSTSIQNQGLRSNKDPDR
ncbi:MAG TPA: hypothetical protein VL003_07520, partial [Pusillimonas sp.]|uniref:hypothetical protein n=1 Tax=Pusillimonas sp. TaxID=3040095 RepID=UPI002C5A6BAA